jgi:type IV secretory pathway VirB10-like protein
MKDDYLWDRSGQPDPEIQHLEDILGELRHQPRPLEIPAGLQTGGNRSFFPRYAIAAAVAMVVLSLGVWLTIQRQRPTDVTAGKSQESKPTDVKAGTPQEDSKTAAASPIDEKKLSTLSARNNTPTPQLTKDPQPPRVRTASSSRVRRTLRTPRMSVEELAEAEMAKERLMLALRLASSKLNYAQKKTQGSGPANQVHNQHKIG